MTSKGEAIERCRELARFRDVAPTLEERRYYEGLFDSAVEDLITINRWNRRTAIIRLRRMRAA